MTRWSEQFSGIAIHQTLKQLNDWLTTDVPDIDAEHDIEKRRLQKSLGIIAEIVSNIDPEFYPEQYLAQLNQQLSQPPIWNSLQNYHSSPASQYLRDANEGITAVAPTVTQLASLSQPRASREILKSIESAHDAFHEKLDRLFGSCEIKVGQNKDLLEQLEQQQLALKDAQAALKHNVESSFTNWQETYTNAQIKRAEDFSSSQIERAKNLDDTLREWTAKSDIEIKDLNTAHTSKLTAAFDKYQSDVDAMIVDMKKKHEAILSIHGLVGTDGVAGGYQRGATDEQKSANHWRLISMSALALAAIWILIKYCLGFELTQAGEVNWAEVATAVSLTVVLVGAASYAARQSKMHRETEQQMRWFALEVKAIDPFLSSLPIEEQNALKKQLVQKLFGQNRLSADKSEGSVDPAVFKSITESLISFIKCLGQAVATSHYWSFRSEDEQTAATHALPNDLTQLEPAHCRL